MQNFKRVLALVLSLMMVATMFGGAISASAAEDEINAVFSAMESYSTVISQTYSLVDGLDGSAQQCTLSGDLMIHIYNDTRTNPPLDITWATHVVFDLWVSDGAAFSAAIQAAGDCGFNLDDADHESAWGGSGGTINRDATFRPAFANLKDGWNHIVLPLDAESECWNLASARFYAVGASFAGITVALDDIRFVDQLALDDTIAKRTVAKDATIAIKAVPAVNDITLANEAVVEAAATAFNAVDADYVDLVKDVAKLEAAVAKIAALKEAAGDSANQEAADVVIAQIAALNVQSLNDKAAVEAARAAYEALTKGQKALVSNLSALEAAEATIKALTPVDAQYRSLDLFRDMAWDTNGGSSGPADNYLEGTGAVKKVLAGDSIFLLTYADERNPVNIAGATHMTFDLWVADGAAFGAAIQAAGDCGINVQDSAHTEQWGDNSAGCVDRAVLKAAMANLKDGWNHIVLAMNEESKATDVNTSRIYAVGSAGLAGQEFIVDDIRFVNQVALDTVVADRTAAKDATIAIKAIPALDAITVDDQAVVTAAAEAYAAVKDEYKGMVQNADAIAAAQAKIDELNAPIPDGPSDQEIADVVIAQIAALNVQSLDDKAAVEAARAAFDALTDAQKALVNNVAALEAAEAAIKALTPVDVQFRSFDLFRSVAITGGIDGQGENANYLEGSAALKAVANGGAGAFFHIYIDDHENTPAMNAAGGEFLIFDLFISDASGITNTEVGDAACNLSSTGAWDNNEYGRIDGSYIRNMYANLQTGWNHIVLPISTKNAGDALWAFRLYHTDVMIPAGVYMIMDDVRVVNQLALDTTVADRTAAKDATIAIKAIPALDVITVDDQAIVTAAAEAYAAVKDEYKGLVQNADAIAAAQAKIDELNVPVVEYTFDGTYFYEDGALVEAYQVIDFEGCVYFVSDYNKVAKNCTLYLGEKFIDEPGYYTFDDQGRAVDFSGVRDGYVFIHNVMQKAYQVVTVNGAQYFINDGNKVATNCTLYLTTAFVETPGYYSFDAEGKMSAATGILNGKYYENGTVARLYELVEVDGVTYFVNDGYNVAKDCVLYLGEKFAPGAAGWYTFDATGAVVNYIA